MAKIISYVDPDFFSTCVWLAIDGMLFAAGLLRLLVEPEQLPLDERYDGVLVKILPSAELPRLVKGELDVQLKLLGICIL